MQYFGTLFISLFVASAVGSRILIWPFTASQNSRLRNMCKLGEFLQANGHAVTLLLVDSYKPERPLNVYDTSLYAHPADVQHFQMPLSWLAAIMESGSIFNA